MREGAAFAVRKNLVRFALIGGVGAGLSGCAESTRFADAGNPFTNPFSTAAPTPTVSEAPLSSAHAPRHDYAVSAHSSPAAVASSPLPAPSASGSLHARAEPVGGSAAGWSAVGGSPVIVGASDSAATLSERYGVPEAALLNANGLRSASEVHNGMRVVIPIYNAHGGDTRVARAEEAPRARVGERAEDDREEKAKAHHAKRDDDEDSDRSRKAERSDSEHKKAKVAARDDSDDSDNDRLSKSLKAKKHEKMAEEDSDRKSERMAKAEHEERVEKTAKLEKSAKAERAPAVAEAKPEPRAKEAAKPARVDTQVAKAEPAKAAPKPETDPTPTGGVNAASANGEGKPSDNGQFRWPARGRIIQGFKSGGNDGINISLPEGTSVRAAEDGKVAYAGNALKGYGNLVLIRHANGFVTAYANNGELSVKAGDTVKRGQVVAKSGQTGDVSTPQLHFELRKGQTPVDPTNYLAGL